MVTTVVTEVTSLSWKYTLSVLNYRLLMHSWTVKRVIDSSKTCSPGLLVHIVKSNIEHRLKNLGEWASD